MADQAHELIDENEELPPEPAPAPIRVNSVHMTRLLIDWYESLRPEEQSYVRRDPNGMKRVISRVSLHARTRGAKERPRRQAAHMNSGGTRVSYPGQPMMPSTGPLRPGQSRVKFPGGVTPAGQGPAPGETIVKIPGRPPQVLSRGGQPAQQIHQAPAAPPAPAGVQFPEPSDPSNPIRPGETRVRIPKKPEPQAAPAEHLGQEAIQDLAHLKDGALNEE